MKNKDTMPSELLSGTHIKKVRKQKKREQKTTKQLKKITKQLNKAVDRFNTIASDLAISISKLQGRIAA